MPVSKMKLVAAWAEIHHVELMNMWLSKEFYKINGLS